MNSPSNIRNNIREKYNSYVKDRSPTVSKENGSIFLDFSERIQLNSDIIDDMMKSVAVNEQNPIAIFMQNESSFLPRKNSELLTWVVNTLGLGNITIEINEFYLLLWYINAIGGYSPINYSPTELKYILHMSHNDLLKFITSLNPTYLLQKLPQNYSSLLFHILSSRAAHIPADIFTTKRYALVSGYSSDKIALLDSLYPKKAGEDYPPLIHVVLYDNAKSLLLEPILVQSNEKNYVKTCRKLGMIRGSCSDYDTFIKELWRSETENYAYVLDRNTNYKVRSNKPTKTNLKSANSQELAAIFGDVGVYNRWDIIDAILANNK